MLFSHLSTHRRPPHYPFIPDEPTSLYTHAPSLVCQLDQPKTKCPRCDGAAGTTNEATKDARLLIRSLGSKVSATTERETMERSMMMKFLSEAGQVKRPADAERVLASWEPSAASEGWWIPASEGNAGYRLATMVQAVVTLVMQAPPGASRTASGKTGGVTRSAPRSGYLATVMDRDGKVVVDGEGEPLERRFNAPYEAEKWAQRRLIDCMGSVAVVRDVLSGRETRTTRERAERAAVRSVGGKTTTRDTSCKDGGWNMRARNDRASFSRG